MAKVLDCDLVYALVPHKPVEDVIRDRAIFKVTKLVEKVDTQMKLEAQQLSNEKLKEQILFETERLLREMPRDLWED